MLKHYLSQDTNLGVECGSDTVNESQSNFTYEERIFQELRL